MTSSLLPQNPRYKTLITPVLGLICCAGLMLSADIPLAEFFRAFAGSWWVRCFEIVTVAGDSKWTLIPTLALTVVCWRWKREIALRALVIFGAVAGSGLSANLIKVLLCRYRPVAYFDHGLIGFDPFGFIIQYERNSFPSGHATTAISAAFALGLLAPRLRYIFWGAGVIIAFSRVAITAHYLSDVLAGGMLGAYWAAGLFHLLEKRNKRIAASKVQSNSTLLDDINPTNPSV